MNITARTKAGALGAREGVLSSHLMKDRPTRRDAAIPWSGRRQSLPFSGRWRGDWKVQYSGCKGSEVRGREKMKLEKAALRDWCDSVFAAVGCQSVICLGEVRRR